MEDARSGADSARAPQMNGTPLSDEGALDSVVMVARVLDELAIAQQPLGVTQLARQLDHTKARVHRYLASLKQVGLVEQDAATERYRLGWKLFQLGEAASQQFDLRRIADAYLKRLRDLTGLSALLAVSINGQATVIATAEADRNVSITVKPGNRPEGHCSAQGRIVLSFLGETALARVLSRKLVALTPHSMIESALIRERLAAIRTRLYEDAPNEVLVGINVLAAPILRDSDVLVGTIGVIGSMQDIPSPPTPQLIEAVTGCGAAISAVLNSQLYEQRGIDIPKSLRDIEP